MANDMTHFTRSLLVLTCAASISAGCASSSPGDATDAAPAAIDAEVNRADAAPLPSNAAVYAHSSTSLYRINPDTLVPALVAGFSFAGTARNITDIAVDKEGTMLGISLDEVYSIDTTTGACTLLAPMDGEFSSLSFVPKDPQDLASPEILIAADFDGNVFEINSSTGVSTQVGSFGGGLGSSGDIVSVRGFGTLATVNVPNQATDSLAWIAPDTFAATVIGDTGHDRIFGLGFWKKKVYGFTDEMKFLEINFETGAARVIETGAVKWWGAGVTTVAPIVE